MMNLVSEFDRPKSCKFVCTVSAMGQLAHVGRRSSTSSHCSILRKAVNLMNCHIIKLPWISCSIPYALMAMRQCPPPSWAKHSKGLHSYEIFQQPRWNLNIDYQKVVGIKIGLLYFPTFFLGSHWFLNPFDLNSPRWQGMTVRLHLHACLGPELGQQVLATWEAVTNPYKPTSTTVWDT